MEERNHLPVPSPPRLRILVVDDDPHVGRFVCELLGRDHDVVAIRDAALALAELLDDPERDIVFCALKMASATGPQIRWVLERAGLPVAKRFVFMSVDDHVNETENDNEVELPPRLKKPISSASLATAVGNMTELGFDGSDQI